MSGCIIWHKCCDKRGYGATYRDGKVVKAHRVALADHMGVPLSDLDGQVVRHTCDNPPCVNPEHLLLGTQADNVKDMVERGRHVGTRGREYVHTLTMTQREYIKKNHKHRCKVHSVTALAKMFGVARSTIQRYI